MRHEILRKSLEEKIHLEHGRIIASMRSSYQRTHQHTLLINLLFAGLLVLVIICCAFLKAPQVAIAAILGSGILWLLLKRPSIGLWIVFFGAGIPSLMLPIPGHQLRPVEMGLLLCLFLTITLRPRFSLQLSHGLALLFLTIALISFLHVPEINNQVNGFGANKRLYDLSVVILALFCGTFLSRYIKNVSGFLVTAVLSNIPIYLISLCQALNIHLPPVLMPDQDPALSGDAGRLVGPFDGAATFGIYLTYLFAISLSCWLSGTNKRDRSIGLAMMLITSLTLVGAGTRSALIASGVMLLVALTMTGRIKQFLICVLVALAGFAAFPNLILAHLNHAQTSTSNRLFLWNEAIKLIENHPVIGIGLEQFRHYYDQLIISESTQLNQNGISVHNQYLEWGLEGGITWMLAGTLFLISVVIICWYAYYYAHREKRALYLTGMLGALSALITSFLDVPFDDVEGAVFLCLLMGIALGWAVPLAKVRLSAPRKRQIRRPEAIADPLHREPVIPASAEALLAAPPTYEGEE